jgi:hypothetical protein
MTEIPRTFRMRWVVTAAIVSALAGGLYQQRRGNSIRDARERQLRVRLVDARTMRPIAGSEVTVYSDNGTRCIAAPCPTNGKEWKGRTDAAGYVTIPRSAIQLATNISTRTHSADLIAKAKRSGRNGWVVEMTSPDSTHVGQVPR